MSTWPSIAFVKPGSMRLQIGQVDIVGLTNFEGFETNDFVNTLNHCMYSLHQIFSYTVFSAFSIVNQISLTGVNRPVEQQCWT